MNYRVLSAILLAIFVSLSAIAQNKRISIGVKAQPIKKVLQQIQDASGYSIVYSDDVVADSIYVSIDAKQKSVAEILNETLPDKRLFYKMISENLIVIGGRTLRAADRKSAGSVLVQGRLTDESDKPVSFASIGLLKDKTYLSGSTSDENGYFQVSYAFENAVGYEIRVSGLGYKELSVPFVYPDTSALKHLVMKQEERTLATVNVTATRPAIERKADRFIVNVEGSSLANGFNGLEVLQKSPGVWVGSDGSITLKGNQSVMVMINDVVQRMSSGDLAEFLRNLRSEDISKIEIISNPPSEFEAAGSGGIIHIVLKKSRQDGLIGSVSVQYRQQEKQPAYGTNMSLNYKYKSLYLFGSLSLGKEKSDYIATNDITYPDQSFYSSHTTRFNDNSREFYRLGVAYDLSKNQSLTLQTIETEGELNQYFDTEIDFTRSSRPLTGSARSEWFRKPYQGSTTLNYVLKLDSLGSGLKVIGDYVRNTKTELNDFYSRYTVSEKNSTFRNNTPNSTNLYSVQTDFTKVLPRDLEFKAGLKFVSTERDNEVLNEDLIGTEWVVNKQLSNHFIYSEYLSMAYASINKIKGKTNIKLGLRAEQTRMNGESITSGERFSRNYIGLFPSLFITQQLDEEKKNSLYFSYSRRLQRPSFADLNPYRLQFDNYLTQLGNPDLLPEYTHKIELGSLFWKGFSAEIYYSLTTDKIAQLASPVSDNIIEYQTRNFSNSYEYGFSVDAPVKVNAWWTVRNGLALYNLAYRLDTFRIRQTSLYLRSAHDFSFKGLFDIDVSLDYTSPYVTANTHHADRFITDIGMSKRLLSKTLQLRLYASDVFNTFREKNYTTYNSTRIDFYQKRPTRTFSLTVSYSFSSGKKFSNKKIELSNEEEKRRLGN
ncbi:outer membrane beta-barrel family protein [Pedobacter ginsengisoli]|uniref:outer membrane beta-barrel family protein n=1 Tax=Pedobacter ginsengisoli TaxID=363852 RepID=UPI00255094A1|nr:outer membrane beta-barrel family protein [Pedobacter ginsengisoli]